MPIEIRELDPALPESLTTALPLLGTALAADAPLYPPPTEGYLNLIAGPRPSQDRVFVVLVDDGTPIAFGNIAVHHEANRDMFWGDLSIPPEYRADATAPLLDACQGHARRHGAKRLVLAVTETASGYPETFAARGGRVVDVERRAQLDLKTIDRDQYAAWAAPSEKNAHYRIEMWVGPTPEDLLPAREEASVAMRDAPTGDLEFEPPPPNVDRRRASEQRLKAIGVREYTIAAFTDDATIAGFHQVFVLPDFALADVGDTGVPAAFRGHGLGLRLKADLTLRLLESEPHLTAISTWNNSDNGPMLRVNDALGYRTGELWNLWQFDL
jgi:GNAT superfamily N-acetyltransferase